MNNNNEVSYEALQDEPQRLAPGLHEQGRPQARPQLPGERKPDAWWLSPLEAVPCYHPLSGWYSREVNASGKRSVVFSQTSGLAGPVAVQVPCGRCIGCRLEKSRQWAVRCVHESQLHESNCFITLTYDEAHVPYGGSLCKADFQKFMKRLRRRFPRKKGDGILYYHCGEYGEQTGRPHYHACIFNFDWPDKVLWRLTPQGHRVFRSAILEELWPAGFATSAAVTFESAAYVARYVMKKITGPKAREHYETIESLTGEIVQRKPEYTTMSLKPAIGKEWFKRYCAETYRDDSVVARGIEMKPPKYYDSLFEHVSAPEMARIKSERKKGAAAHRWNNTPERLAVREEVKRASIATLKREVE